MSKSFRYDIGFLRFIAVVAVILYHFNIPFFSGGFVGVDIFFVISGFLMTKILLIGIEKENFSLKNFYFNRAKRIIPVLLVVLLSVLLLTLVFSFVVNVFSIGTNVFYSSFFLSNIIYYLHNGYFEQASQANPLLHTWSLSVEWQFYLIYPLFTLRMWEMMLGGFSFLFAGNVKQIIGNKNTLKMIVLAILYTVLILSIFFFNKDFVWPSAYALVPTVATFLILSMDINPVIVKAKLFQYTGNISYSLYLWHWPIFVFSSFFFPVTSPLVTILGLVLTIILSVITYTLVEKKKSSFKIYQIGIGLFIVAVLGQILSRYPVDKLIYGDKYKVEVKNNRVIQFNEDCYINDLESISSNRDKCLKLSPDKKNILLIGDSHSAELHQSLKEVLGENINIAQLSTNQSLYRIDQKRGSDVGKSLVHYIIDEYIPANKEKIDLIIFSEYFMAYHNDINTISDDVNKLINYFSNNGIKMVVVGETPSYKIPFPDILKLGKYFNNKDLLKDYLEQDSRLFNTRMKKEVRQDSYVDIYDMIDFKENEEGQIMMFDKDHLTKEGADQVVSYLLKEGKLNISQ